MTSELLLISANQSGCFIFPEVWNVLNVSQNDGSCGKFRVGCAKGLLSFWRGKTVRSSFFLVLMSFLICQRDLESPLCSRWLL